MKKLVLFIGLTVLAFGAFAEKVPSITVHKQQGGLSGFFNLYNYVHFTPGELTPSGVGRLDCSGPGLTACRVPTCTSLTVIDGSTTTTITEAGKVNALMSAVNNVISQYEAAQAQSMGPATKDDSSKGVSIPSVYTKTIALAGNGGGLNTQKTVTYVVRGEVTASGPNSSTMKIYIEKVNLLTANGN